MTTGSLKSIVDNGKKYQGRKITYQNIFNLSKRWLAHEALQTFEERYK